MADMTRAADLVETIGRDDAFRAEVEAAPTVSAKRQVLDARGYQDVGLDEMRSYVESKGGTLVAPDTNRELSDQELSAVAGGLTDTEAQWAITGGVAAGYVAMVAAA